MIPTRTTILLTHIRMYTLISSNNIQNNYYNNDSLNNLVVQNQLKDVQKRRKKNKFDEAG
jgi:hypothetical protein